VIAWLLVIVVIWTLLGCLTGKIAQDKGRSFGGFWLYGLLVFPVALIHSLVMALSIAGLEQQALERGERRKCPHRAELVKREATLCKHCHQALEPLPPTSPAPGTSVWGWRVDERSTLWGDESGR
jgi:hypothetical protein